MCDETDFSGSLNAIHWKGEVGNELKKCEQIVIYNQMSGKIELMQDVDGGMVA